MSEVSGSRIEIRCTGLGGRARSSLGARAEGWLFADSRSHLVKDGGFGPGIQSCRVQPRSLIICREGAAGRAP